MHDEDRELHPEDYPQLISDLRRELHSMRALLNAVTALPAVWRTRDVGTPVGRSLALRQGLFTCADELEGTLRHGGPNWRVADVLRGMATVAALVARKRLDIVRALSTQVEVAVMLTSLILRAAGRDADTPDLSPTGSNVSFARLLDEIERSFDARGKA